MSEWQWRCELCGGTGIVSTDDHEGVWGGASSVLDHHRRSRPDCPTDAMALRVEQLKGQLECVGGPLDGSRITDPRPDSVRIYATGSTSVAARLTRTRWPEAIGFYEVTDERLIWHNDAWEGA